MTRVLQLQAAVREALAEEMRRDPRVVMIGGDVRTSVSGYSAGLVDEFGERRVIDMPFAEAAMSGAANGAAMAGLRPVLDLGNLGFSLTAMDQITNEGPKAHYKFGGQITVPLVYLLDYSSRGWGPQHDQAIYALLAHMPGLKVAVPSSPAEAKGLLKAAIRDDNPVAFTVAHPLKSVEGPVPEAEVGDDDHVLELGRGVVVRPGTDVSLVASGAMVGLVSTAAEQLAADGIDAEVVDLRSLVPLDWDLLETTARKTGRVVVCDHGHYTCGFGPTIAAGVQERAFADLRGPVRMVTTLDVPVPYELALADRIVPSVARVVDAARQLLTES